MGSSLQYFALIFFYCTLSSLSQLTLFLQIPALASWENYQEVGLGFPSQQGKSVLTMPTLCMAHFLCTSPVPTSASTLLLNTQVHILCSFWSPHLDTTTGDHLWCHHHSPQASTRVSTFCTPPAHLVCAHAYLWSEQPVPTSVAHLF